MPVVTTLLNRYRWLPAVITLALGGVGGYAAGAHHAGPERDGACEKLARELEDSVLDLMRNPPAPHREKGLVNVFFDDEECLGG